MKRIMTTIQAFLLIILLVGVSSCGNDTLGNFYSTSVTFSDGALTDTLTLDIAKDMCSTTKTGDLPKYEKYTDVFANITVSVASSMPGLTINGYTIDYIPQSSEDGTHALVMPPTLDSLTDQGSNNIHIATNSSATFQTTCFSTGQKAEYRKLIGWTDTTTGALPVNTYTITTTTAVPGSPATTVTTTSTTAPTVPSGTSNTATDGTVTTITYSVATTYNGYLDTWQIAAGSIYSNLYTSIYTFRITLHCTDDSGKGRDLVVERTVYLSDYYNC